MSKAKKNAGVPKDAAAYRHPTADLPARPEIGTQAHFKKTKAPTTYRFDSSLSPALDWDGRNPARETAEALIRELAEAGLKATSWPPWLLPLWQRGKKGDFRNANSMT